MKAGFMTSVWPVKRALSSRPGRRRCHSDGQLANERHYVFLGRPAIVFPVLGTTQVRQTIDRGPALPREQVVTLGRWLAALQVRAARPEACEHDSSSYIITEFDRCARKPCFILSNANNIVNPCNTCRALLRREYPCAVYDVFFFTTCGQTVE